MRKDNLSTKAETVNVHLADLFKKKKILLLIDHSKSLKGRHCGFGYIY